MTVTGAVQLGKGRSGEALQLSAQRGEIQLPDMACDGKPGKGFAAACSSCSGITDSVWLCRGT